MPLLSLFLYLLAVALAVYLGAINLTLLVMPLCGSNSASFRAAGIRLGLTFLCTFVFYWILSGGRFFQPYQALMDPLFLDEEPWSGVATAIPASVILGLAVFFYFPIPVDVFLGLSLCLTEMVVAHRFQSAIFNLGVTLLFMVTSVCTSLLLYFLVDRFLYSYHAASSFDVAMKGYSLSMGLSQALVVYIGLTRRDHSSRLVLTIISGWLFGIFAHVYLRRKSKADAFAKYPQVASEFAQRNNTNNQSIRESRGLSPTAAAGEPGSPGRSFQDSSRPRRIAEAEEAGTNLVVLRTEELFIRPLVYLIYTNILFNLCEIPLSIIYIFLRLPGEFRPSNIMLYVVCLFMVISFAELGYRQNVALSSKWIKLTPSQAFVVQLSVLLNLAIASTFSLPSSFCLNLLCSMIVTTLSDTLRGWRPTDKKAVWKNVAMISLLIGSSMLSAACLIIIRKIQASK